MNNNTSAAPGQAGKPKKVRQHKILGIPVLAAFLLMAWGTEFYGEPSTVVLLLTGSAAAKCLVAALLGLLLLVIHKAWFKPEFKGCFGTECFKDRKVLMVLGIMLAVDMVLSIWSISDYGFAAPGFTTFSLALMAGVAEEAVFRGLIISTMMRAYKDKGTYLPALILSSILFGLYHLVNLGGGASLSYTVLQIGQAALLGIFFGALYLITGSVLPGMLYHFLHDFVAFMQANQNTGIVETSSFKASDWGSLVILCALDIALAVWMLRGQKEQILALWQDIWQKPEEA